MQRFEGKSELHLKLKDPGATLQFGKTLGAELAPGDIIALVGDLGSGKTLLTTGIAVGMGVRDRVTSPTYTLVQEYRGPIPLFHFDPYRLERPEEMAELGFYEYLDRGGVIVIEWADRIASLLPTELLWLSLDYIKYKDNSTIDLSIDPSMEINERNLTCIARGERYTDLLNRLESCAAITGMSI